MSSPSSKPFLFFIIYAEQNAWISMLYNIEVEDSLGNDKVLNEAKEHSSKMCQKASYPESLYLEMPLGLPRWDIWRKSWWVPALPGMITQILPLYPNNCVLLQCLWRFYSLGKTRQKVGRAQSSRAEVTSWRSCRGAVAKLQKTHIFLGSVPMTQPPNCAADWH